MRYPLAKANGNSLKPAAVSQKTGKTEKTEKTVKTRKTIKTVKTEKTTKTVKTTKTEKTKKTVETAKTVTAGLDLVDEEAVFEFWFEPGGFWGHYFAGVGDGEM
jgi:hypothetical protein